MATGIVDTSVVREAIDQVYTILSGLKSQIDGPELLDKGLSDELSRAVAVDTKMYRNKCKELDTMARLYSQKCDEYDKLLVKYHSCISQQQQDSEGASKHASLEGTKAKGLSRSYFASPGDNEPKPSKPHLLTSPSRRESVSPRSKTEAGGSPTKRSRQDSSINKIGGVLLPSSPPILRPMLHYSQRGWRRSSHQKHSKPSEKATLPQQPALPPLGSSQETRLDFSDNAIPADSSVVLCPESDNNDGDADDNAACKAQDGGEIGPLDAVLYPPDPNPRAATAAAAAAAAEERGAYPAHGLKAVGGCKECEALYSMSGLARPKRDFSGLCTHRKKYRQSTRASKEQQQQQAYVRQASPERVKQAAVQTRIELPSTPEHFWDIDYFPPIRIEEPDSLLKTKGSSQSR